MVETFENTKIVRNLEPTQRIDISFKAEYSDTILQALGTGALYFLDIHNAGIRIFNSDNKVLNVSFYKIESIKPYDYKK